MPSSQLSLARPAPPGSGARLPGFRMPGVFRYRPSSPPEKAVSAAPATAVGTNGVSSAAPMAISVVARPLHELLRRHRLQEGIGAGREAVHAGRGLGVGAPLARPLLRMKAPAEMRAGDLGQGDGQTAWGTSVASTVRASPLCPPAGRSTVAPTRAPVPRSGTPARGCDRGQRPRRDRALNEAADERPGARGELGAGARRTRTRGAEPPGLPRRSRCRWRTLPVAEPPPEPPRRRRPPPAPWGCGSGAGAGST